MTPSDPADTPWGGRPCVGRTGLAIPLLLVMAWNGGAQAAGFYLQDQSVKGGGRAYSGEAADMGAESLWWNPASIAGITQSESYNGISGIIINSTATDHGSTIDYFGHTLPIGGNRRVDDPISNGIVPSGASALRLSDRWALGLSVTSPFSFVTKYPTDSWTGYAALTSRLTTIDLQPSVAWRPTHWLGLGIGPNIEYQVISLSSTMPNLSPIEPDGSQTLHANGWNVGWNAGVQLHLTNSLTFGAAYRSGIEHRLSGKLTVSGLTGPLAPYDVRADAGMHFDTPWAATFGLRWQVTGRLTLNAQAVRQGWSDFDSIYVTSPIVSTTAENYRDTLNGAFGVDYRVTPGWTMRSGIQYDPTPTPGPTRDPRVPDASRWLLSVGTSVQITGRLAVDASFTYIDFHDAAISRDASAYVGTPAQLPIDLDGQLQASGVVVAVGSRLWF